MKVHFIGIVFYLQEFLLFFYNGNPTVLKH